MFNIQKFDFNKSNCEKPIYSLCNYDDSGVLIDIYNKENMIGVNRFMVDINFKDFILNHADLKYNQQNLMIPKDNDVSFNINVLINRYKIS